MNKQNMRFCIRLELLCTSFSWVIAMSHQSVDVFLQSVNPHLQSLDQHINDLQGSMRQLEQAQKDQDERMVCLLKAVGELRDFFPGYLACKH